MKITQLTGPVTAVALCFSIAFAQAQEIETEEIPVQSPEIPSVLEPGVLVEGDENPILQDQTGPPILESSPNQLNGEGLLPIPVPESNLTTEPQLQLEDGTIILPGPDPNAPRDPGELILEPYELDEPPLLEAPRKRMMSRPVFGVLGKPVSGWGFAILEIVPGSAAARMKLEPGDVILSVNGKRACSANTIASELMRSVARNHGLGYVVIDNVRARRKSSQCSGHGSCRTSNAIRFQKIWFRM